MRGSKFRIRIQAGVLQLKLFVKEESVAVSSGVAWEIAPEIQAGRNTSTWGLEGHQQYTRGPFSTPCVNLTKLPWLAHLLGPRMY